MDSPTAMVKAITSWRTRASSSWMRVMLTRARWRMAAAASGGTWPHSARVSAAAISTSSHFWNLFSSLQTRPISSRVYRGINWGFLRPGVRPEAQSALRRSRAGAGKNSLSKSGGEIPYPMIPEFMRPRGRKQACGRPPGPPVYSPQGSGPRTARQDFVWLSEVGRAPKAEEGTSSRGTFGVRCFFWCEGPRAASALCRNYGHKQAGRPREWLMLQKMPPCLLEPRPSFLHAVHVSVAADHQEFTRHQSGEERVGVRGIGPQINQQETHPVMRGLPDPPEQLLVLLGSERVHDIGNKKGIVTPR